MNTRQDDYLWDPTADPDAEIEKLERILQPHSARALNLASRELPIQPAASSARPSSLQLRWRGWQLATLGLAAAFAGIAFFHFYRLSWNENSPWPVTVASAGGAESSTLLQVGDSVTTGHNQMATMSVARIGTIEMAADSSVVLTRTGNNKHRLELKYGRLHAKVWAPPGYFGVANRDALALDLGCEFDIEVDPSGSGTLAVRSGWVNYRIHGTGVAVPQDHKIVFNSEMVGTPIRNGADDKFRELIGRLDLLLTSETASNTQIDDLTARIAATAADADRITLLILITRHRELMKSPLYDRLQNALGDPGDDDVINEWWRRLPKQPKRWWLNWRDAF